MMLFISNSIILGVGLAMDAFSVSIVNGLNEPGMSKKKACCIAFSFALFQFGMPMIGWICVHTIAEHFLTFQKFIPLIALILLLFIGGKMLLEGISSMKSSGQTDGSDKDTAHLDLGTLLIQSVATSIDALSVGFAIAKYNAFDAFLCSVIIAVTTFIICFTGVVFGKKFGERISGKADVLGGLILITIGIEIFIKGVFF